jgi:hypothetical protein
MFQNKYVIILSKNTVLLQLPALSYNTVLSVNKDILYTDKITTFGSLRTSNLQTNFLTSFTAYY